MRSGHAVLLNEPGLVGDEIHRVLELPAKTEDQIASNSVR